MMIGVDGLPVSIQPDHYVRNSGGQPRWVRGGGEEEEGPGGDDDERGGDVVQEDVPLPSVKHQHQHQHQQYVGLTPVVAVHQHKI